MAGMSRKQWWLWLLALVLIGPLILAVICYFLMVYPFRNGI
jgi:hypothetical protein